MPSPSLVQYCVRWDVSYAGYMIEVTDMNNAVARRGLGETPVHYVTKEKYEEMLRISKLTKLIMKGK